MALRDRLARLRLRWLLLIVLVGLIEVGYVFIVSAGRIDKWPTYLTFLDDQAEGFRAGHLHMAVEPPAVLLAQPNPFDASNEKLWYWDASLHKGHYYLYWGPVPALLLAAFKTLFRVKAQFGDQYVVFALASLQLLAGARLIARVRSLLFPELPYVFVVMAVLAFGFVNPTLHSLARGGVYEAAIVGGHAFLITGLLFAFESVWRAGTGDAHGWHLSAAGACWALALGCRISIAPAVALLVVLTALVVAAGAPQYWRRTLVEGACLGAPVAIGLTVLLAYNWARFDAWLDFGLHYQLTWIPFRVSWTYVLANIYSYAFRPLVLGCKFPFLFAVQGLGATAFPKWFMLPEGYAAWEQQHVSGFLNAVPLSWFAPVAVFAAGASVWRLFRHQGSPDARTAAIAWLSASTAIAATVTMIVLLTLFNSTMRYLGDGAGALALLGTMGAWILYWRFRQSVMLRRAVVLVYIVLALGTVAVGLALGFEGQYKHFRQNNPALLDKLEVRFSICRG